MDPWLPERLRRLAEVVRAEREIEAQTRAAYAELLKLIARDVLEDSPPIVAAVPDPNRDRNQIDAAWLLLLLRIRRPIEALFKKRRRKAKAPTSYDDRAITKYIAGVNEHLKNVPKEVYDDLNKVIADGLKAGLTEQEIRAAIAREITPGHDQYDKRLDDVSTRVARTEAISAFNAGDESGYLDVAQAENVAFTKRWLAVPDNRVRPAHAEADGQVVPADGFFTVGGFSAKYPGDYTLPAHLVVNCRCTAIYTRHIVAAGGTPMATVQSLPNGWMGVIAGLDILTGDDRYLATPQGGVRTREYPLSLTLGHVGGEEVPVIGSVDRVWVANGLLYGQGKLDLGGEAGAEFARQLTEGYVNTVSIHPDEVTAELQLIDPSGNVVKGEDAQALIEANDYNIPEGYTQRLAFIDWRLAGLAVVPIPAYTEARIDGIYNYTPTGPQAGDALVASVAIGGQVFHSEFFTYAATGPTKMTVTDDGHIYGHVRFHGTCYQYGQGRGNGGYCVEPPMSACGYAKFHAHSAKLDDGTTIDVGALTFGDGHESRGGLIASRAHYDDVAYVAAKVVASDDEWGVFITGEVVDEFRDKAYDLLLSPLSGHWEPDADNDGYLEMLAAHIVVTPGYNVRRIVATFNAEREATSVIVTRPAIKSPDSTPAPSGRALVAAAIRDHRRAAILARRAGVDPKSRTERALARINGAA